MNKKSLGELVNEVVNNSVLNENEKVEALVKIGLPWIDAKRALYYAAKVGGNNGTTYTFGIELECFVDYRTIAQESAMFELRRYGHEDTHRVFKFVPDGSVHGLANSIECVSPVLNGTDGFNSVKEACNKLNEHNARVNKTCGFHVHIGAADMTERQKVNIFVNYQMCEKVIDSFMALSRRANNAGYCASISRYGFSTCATLANVARLMGGRYFKVNACAYDRHRTIEFRHHQGTTDAVKVQNWVKFLLQLCEWSKHNRLTEEVTSIDALPFLDNELKEYYKGRKEVLRG